MVDRNLPHAAYFQVAREPAYPGMDNPQPVGVIHAHERQHADKPAYVIVKDAVLEQGFIQTTRRDDTIRIIPLVLYFHGKAARVQITVPENQPVGVNPGVMNLEELTAAVILYILEFRQARRKRAKYVISDMVGNRTPGIIRIILITSMIGERIVNLLSVICYSRNRSMIIFYDEVPHAEIVPVIIITRKIVRVIGIGGRRKCD